MTVATNTDPSIAAVIVTFNRKDLLQQCLDGVLAQSRPADSIYVIDNASTDGTEEMIRAQYRTSVKYVHLPQNSGGAGGFHHGMELAYNDGHHYIWLMDDDVRPDGLCLEHLLGSAQFAKVVTPLHLAPNGTIVDANPVLTEGRPSVRDFYREASTLPATIELSSVTFEGPLIHRSVITAVGLPRKDFFICWDDIEYSWRIAKCGLGPLACVTAARMVRLLPQRVSEDALWRTYHDGRNGLYVRRTHRRPRSRGISVDMHYFLSFLKALCLRRAKFTSLPVRVAAWWDSYSEPMSSRYLPAHLQKR